MSGTFTVSAGNTSVNFIYTQPTEKMQAVVTAAAHYLWDLGSGNHGTIEAPILFSSLTNQQKLNLVDAHLRQVVMDLAKSYSVKVAEGTARSAAITDADKNLNLP